MSVAVAFAGSRNLGPQASALVGALAGQLARAGYPISTGCATGADQAAIVGVLGNGAAAQLTIFAAFGPAGQGAGHVSAVAQVQAAATAGATVHWWAGGGPQVPVKGRLVRRAAALVAAIHQAGGVLVAFPAFPALAGSGTWGELRQGIAQGVPVFVFPCWCWSTPAPAALPALPGGGSSWQPVTSGPFIGSFSWQSSQPSQPSLF